MSEPAMPRQLGVLRRLTRGLGDVWPQGEQELILQAIFGPPALGPARFAAWRDGLRIEQPFDHAVMRLLPLLYLRLCDLGVDDPLMGRLKGVYRRAWSDTHLLFHGAAPAVAAIQGAGIKTLLLKGAPLALAHYRNFGARPMADVDIAVPFADARAAFAALEQAGWQPVARLSDDDLTFRHATSFRGPAGHEVDLHWHMLFESADVADDEPFWAHTVPLRLREIPVLGLNPALNLLHILAHGLRPNVESPVRWIADAANLLRDEMVVIDWDLFCETARRLAMSHRLALGLNYLVSRNGEAVPQAVLARLGAAPCGLSERLELAVLARRQRRLVMLDRVLLVAAEYCRRSAKRGVWGALQMLPEFARYRLGIAAWPQLPRGARRRLGATLRRVRGKCRSA